MADSEAAASKTKKKKIGCDLEVLKRNLESSNLAKVNCEKIDRQPCSLFVNTGLPKGVHTEYTPKQPLSQ